MKTTVDLPDDLVQRIKIRAVQERKPLKRFFADLLLRGLEAPPPVILTPAERLPEGIMVNEGGFPIFRCAPGAPATRMSPEELLGLEQKTLVEEDLKRAGLAP